MLIFLLMPRGLAPRLFTTITVDYSRLAVRGRKVFGNLPDGKGLVPYGRIWRLGANGSTKITVDTDVSVLGNVLPAGKYALYAFPEENEWEVVFHTNSTESSLKKRICSECAQPLKRPQKPE